MLVLGITEAAWESVIGTKMVTRRYTENAEKMAIFR
jgi:hypothetical protein